LTSYTVSVVGLGKIGLPLAAQFAHSGLTVIGCDVVQAVVDSINSGRSHIKEEAGLEALVAEAVAAGRLSATTDTHAAVSRSNVVVIIVPLIVDEQHNIDYRYIDAATEAVASGLQPGTLVIYETTLPVGTTRERFGPMLEQGSGLTLGADLFLAFSPERVYSGRIFKDLEHYPKVVGGIDPESTERVEAFYKAALQAPAVLVMQNAETAELVKLMETTYRDVNIALANTFARFASLHYLPVDQAIAAANSQPFSHIHRPGIYVGGHCIPVYPYFIINNDPDPTSELLVEARRINDGMAAWALDRLEATIGGLDRKRVLVMGLAYRENVKEVFLSGAVPVISQLADRGAQVLLSDPLYTPAELSRYAEPALLDGEMPECDAVVVQAFHSQYRALDWAELARRGCQAVVDGRNVLDRAEIEAAGMTYLGIGR
jgi:nucleotide sugar dehydrogenase